MYEVVISYEWANISCIVELQNEAATMLERHLDEDLGCGGACGDTEHWCCGNPAITSVYPLEWNCDAQVNEELFYEVFQKILDIDIDDNQADKPTNDLDDDSNDDPDKINTTQ